MSRPIRSRAASRPWPRAWRNLTATGATPIALTDNLNFGNPEKPEIMGQFALAIKGIGEAARALDFPVVSGNVSLYNETQGRAILPTPTIGGVGLIKDVTKSAGIAFAAAGEQVILIGKTDGWLAASAFLATILGSEEGAPPPVDLAVEKRNGDFVRDLILKGRVSACHDLSDGGLAVALAEMAMAGGIGATISQMPTGVPPVAALFGEDQARYLVTAGTAEARRILEDAAAAGVPALALGLTGGSALALPGITPIEVASLTKAHDHWLPAYMAGGN
jgi:phosphoribosylformylglycinamidine (FGAM) synthase-like enzyme